MNLTHSTPNNHPLNNFVSFHIQNFNAINYPNNNGSIYDSINECVCNAHIKKVSMDVFLTKMNIDLSINEYVTNYIDKFFSTNQLVTNFNDEPFRKNITKLVNELSTDVLYKILNYIKNIKTLKRTPEINYNSLPMLCENERIIVYLLPEKGQLLTCFQPEKHNPINKLVQDPKIDEKNKFNLSLLRLLFLNNRYKDKPKPIMFKDIKHGSIDERCRIFNNYLFSHITGFTSSIYSSLQTADEEIMALRLQNLSHQIEFAAKFRCLTFKLCLLAFENQKLLIRKEKTVTQGSYNKDSLAPIQLRRSTNAMNTQNKPKKIEECHISCIPIICDNSKFKEVIENAAAKFEEAFDEDNNLNIEEIVRNNFESGLNQEAISFGFKLYLLSLKDPTFNFLDSDFTKNYDWWLFKKNTNKQNLLSSIYKIIINDHNFYNRIDNSNDSSTIRCIQARDDKKKAHEVLLAFKKSNPLWQKKEPLTEKERKEQKKLRDKINEMTNKLNAYREEVETLESSIQENLIVFLINHFDELKNFLKDRSNINFDHLQIFHHWVTSGQDPKEKLQIALSIFGPSESIIPLNSILGLMLSATIGMPSEINRGVDAETDKTHTIVAELLTEYSNIQDPSENEFESYLEEYTMLLKNTYERYKNEKAPSGATFSTLGEAIAHNQTTTMESFIKENESLIAGSYLRHITNENGEYDEEFEELVMGGIIKDASSLLEPVVDFKFCNTCKPTVSN